MEWSWVDRIMAEWQRSLGEGVDDDVIEDASRSQGKEQQPADISDGRGLSSVQQPVTPMGSFSLTKTSFLSPHPPFLLYIMPVQGVQLLPYEQRDMEVARRLSLVEASAPQDIKRLVAVLPTIFVTTMPPCALPRHTLPLCPTHSSPPPVRPAPSDFNSFLPSAYSRLDHQAATLPTGDALWVAQTLIPDISARPHSGHGYAHLLPIAPLPLLSLCHFLSPQHSPPPTLSAMRPHNGHGYCYPPPPLPAYPTWRLYVSCASVALVLLN
ncbi:unnamed protein product [Closterium sp. Naga37s-1]|nr:unnamed protein product [Closterium sp. Naga37s-1]